MYKWVVGTHGKTDIKWVFMEVIQIYICINIYKIYVYLCKYIFGAIGIVLKWVSIEIGKVCMGKSSHICK